MFDEIIKKLEIELKRELPGFSAQKLMAPLGRRPPIEYLGENIIPKKSAVLILLYPDAGSRIVKTVLIHRPENEIGAHAGQVSFPGGGYEYPDIDLSVTALRETEEEIGVDRKTVSLIGPLTPLYIPVSNYMVHPFVGISRYRPDFSIHHQEVAGLLECEVSTFLSSQNKGTTLKHIKVTKQEMEVPCYLVNGKIIWGATAMILAEMEELLRRAG